MYESVGYTSFNLLVRLILHIATNEGENNRQCAASQNSRLYAKILVNTSSGNITTLSQLTDK